MGSSVVEKDTSDEIFNELDEDQSDSVSLEEMEKFIASNSKLWAMLSVSFGLPVEQCQEVATRVAMELATGRKGQKALEKHISRSQFHRFRRDYIEDAEGVREFFNRTLFEAFDTDGNAVLDEEELDKLLDAVYKTSAFLEDFQSDKLKGGLLMGNMRLPPKETFKELIYENCDDNNDKKIKLPAIQRYLKENRKKTIKEERKEGVHREEREARASRAMLQAEAQAKIKQSTELEAKNKAENWSDCILWEWLEDLWKSIVGT